MKIEGVLLVRSEQHGRRVRIGIPIALLAAGIAAPSLGLAEHR